jgi:benzoate-CoA ligase
MLAAKELPARSDVAMRLCVSAGEPSAKEIGEKFAVRFGCDVLDGIGSHGNAAHLPVQSPGAPCVTGRRARRFPATTIELRGEDGRPVGDGEIGDLFIRGPSAGSCTGPTGRRRARRSRASGPGAATSIARGSDGYYTYAGRSDDMLKVAGQYVSPFEVEAALMRHDAVLERRWSANWRRGSPRRSRTSC